MKIPASSLFSHAIFLSHSLSLPLISSFFFPPPHHVSPISHGEAEKESGTKRRGRKVCFSREDNIPRPAPFLSLLIEHKHTLTQRRTSNQNTSYSTSGGYRDTVPYLSVLALNAKKRLRSPHSERSERDGWRIEARRSARQNSAPKVSLYFWSGLQSVIKRTRCCHVTTC